MPNQSPVKAFLDAAHSWICDDYALDISYICARSGVDLQLLAASIILNPVPFTTNAAFTVSTKEVEAGRKQLFPVSKADALAVVEAAALGHIELFQGILDLAAGKTLDHYSEMAHLDRWFSPLHLRVSCTGAQPPWDFLHDVDAGLRMAEPPFDGTSDLAGWLGLDTNSFSTGTRGITLHVLPPVEVIINETALADDKLTATLHAHPNVDTDQIYLAVRAAPGEGVSGRRQVGKLIQWSDPQDNRRVGKLEVDLQHSDSVLTMLSLGSTVGRRQWFLDPEKARNQRFIALNQFDSDLRMIRQSLFDLPDSRKFEQGISALLFMLGFSPVMPLETDSPDLVVTTPGGRILVVECTTRVADFAQKIGKLVERRSALSKTLAAAKLPSSVVAALVCRLPKDEVAASKEDLTAHGVLLLSSEDIAQALLRVRFVVDADKMLNDAISTLGGAGATS